jgi:transcriptional regulator with XRE-family HTH domain
MTNASAEITRLRAAMRLSEDALASAIGISIEAYSDLERYGDELTSAVSLQQARTLAQLLGVDLLALLSLPAHGERKTLSQLAAELRRQVALGAVTMQEMEAAVGWELASFLESPLKVADQNPIMFLQDLAAYSSTNCHDLVASANAA